MTDGVVSVDSSLDCYFANDGCYGNASVRRHDSSHIARALSGSARMAAEVTKFYFEKEDVYVPLTESSGSGHVSQRHACC